MKAKPTITMRDFFQIPEVVSAQDIQKRNPYGSEPHRRAFETIKKLAAQFGADAFVGDYE